MRVLPSVCSLGVSGAGVSTGSLGVSDGEVVTGGEVSTGSWVEVDSGGLVAVVCGGSSVSAGGCVVGGAV